MGLGDFADSSMGPGTSSKSRGAEDDAKVGDENLPQAEQVTMGEEVNRKSSTLEEKMDESLDKPPQISSTSSERQSSSTTETKKSEGPGRSRDAACDDAVDGMGNNEDWDLSLPMRSSDSQLMAGKGPKSGVEANLPRRKSLRLHSRTSREEKEMPQEIEGSTESSTSHSSQELTLDSRQGLNLCHLHVLLCSLTALVIPSSPLFLGATHVLEQPEETEGSEDGGV